MRLYELSDLISRTWKLLNPRRRSQALLLILLMFIAGISEIFAIGAVVPFLGVLATPERIFEVEYIQPLIKAIGAKEARDLLFPVTVIFCLGVVISAAVRMLLLFVQTKIIYKIGAELSIKMYTQILYQPLKYHVSGSSSDLISGISNKANEVIVSFLYPLALIIGAVMMLTVVSVAVFAVEPALSALTILVFGSSYLIIAHVVKRSLASNSGKIAHLYERQVRMAQEALGGIRDILLDGSQLIFKDRYSRVEQSLRNALSTVLVSRGMPRFIVEGFGMLFIASLAYIYAREGNGIQNVIPTLGVIAVAAQRLVPVIQQLFSSWAAVVGGYSSVNDAVTLCELETPAIWKMPNTSPLPFKKSITLKNAGFEHVENFPVFWDISLDIYPGDRVGIIGETGSGKSTLMDVLMGLLPLSSGQMYVDDELITDKNIREWQANIAHVPQAIFLADMTISENIAFGCDLDAIDPIKVAAASAGAFLTQLIETWPEGYNTSVGERGARLSGGQRQRIGIARAFYKEAKIVVLDEATSALDATTEEQVMKTIDNFQSDTTVLMVAHRLTTLKGCNKIFRLSGGKIDILNGYAEVEKEMKAVAR